jgi:hypothetical protein
MKGVIMKATLFMLVLLVALSAAAQSRTNDHDLKIDNSPHDRTGIVSVAPLSTQATPEIKHGRVSYSGPVVTVAKTKNPLELFNPWAPTESNGGETRVSHDLLTGRPNGVKLLTIRF